MTIYKELPYCVYLTIYSGNRLPPFYIGSTSISKINKGYRGSVSSSKYKTVWNSELVNHPELFQIKILATYKTRKEATEKELSLQLAVRAPTNPLYINLAYARKSFMYGVKQTTEHVEKRISPLRGRKGPKRTEEAIEKFRKKMTGRKTGPMPETQKQKISKSKIGHKDSDATRIKKSNSAKGKPKHWLKNREFTKEVIDQQIKSRKETRDNWTIEERLENSKNISTALKGKKKNYQTNCGKKFICRISDKKEFSKASAGKYLKDLKPYF